MQITITKPIKPLLLRQQFLDAFPAWVGLGPMAIQIFNTGEEVYIIVPDDSDQAVVQAVIDAHDPTLSTRDETAVSQIRTLAQSAVGVRLQDLTATQVKALLAVLLYKNGAINPADLTIRPLKDW